MNFKLTRSAFALALAYPLAFNVSAQTSAPATLPTVEVSGAHSRLDKARNGLSPDTGSAITRISREDLENLPQGDNTPLNQVILQTPGVVQDSYGQLHVRGDHGNVQYRINGVVIPESISGFGQALQTRFADRMSILTGALPAQYGYRTAAIVDIQTKGDDESQQTANNGNGIGFSIGGQGERLGHLELAGSSGPLRYYLSGEAMQSQMGIENPTAGRSALHNETKQGRSFGYLSSLVGTDSRVSVMFGTSKSRFEIPNVPGETPEFALAGQPPKDSATLDARQRESNRFGVLSLQSTIGNTVDYQVSVFQRDTSVRYLPDAVGDLQYLGIAADILRSNKARGLQADLSWRLNSSHTVRAGLFGQRENVLARNDALVFPADDDGVPTSSTPLPMIHDAAGLKGTLWGAYLQDEWKVSPALTVNYGLRFDQAKTVVDERQLSPRLGLVYAISPSLSLHAGYARYFTPPPSEKIDTTSIAKFIGTTNALPSDANTAVRAERSNYLDAGLAWAVTPKLTLSFGGYYRDIAHLHDEGQFGNALLFSAFNFKEGRISGVDLSANFKDRNFSAYLNVGVTHSRAREIETGQFNFDPDELDYLATHWASTDHEQRLSISAGASWRLADGWSTSASALYGSGLRRGFANTDKMPAYATANASVSKAIGKLDLRLSVINLFDRRYQLRDGSGIGVGAPQYGQRRTFAVSADYAF